MEMLGVGFMAKPLLPTAHNEAIWISEQDTGPHGWMRAHGHTLMGQCVPDTDKQVLLNSETL